MQGKGSFWVQKNKNKKAYNIHEKQIKAQAHPFSLSNAKFCTLQKIVWGWTIQEPPKGLLGFFIFPSSLGSVVVLKQRLRSQSTSIEKVHLFSDFPLARKKDSPKQNLHTDWLVEIQNGNIKMESVFNNMEQGSNQK